jgi:hypothetical protein
MSERRGVADDACFFGAQACSHTMRRHRSSASHAPPLDVIADPADLPPTIFTSY